jgi:Uri superfamily endonuclease
MKNVMKGSYIILITLAFEQTIRVGNLGGIHFSAGQYAYVGSAMGGFESRLRHHFRKTCKPHWHIDYLLQKAQISSIIISENHERIECNIATLLQNKFQCIVGFGSSDCKCKGHLFFLYNKMGMELRIGAMLKSLGYSTKPYIFLHRDPAV